ncbi:MAG: hypothetical protein CMP22_07630 [Rickettsiales bacterium]|nr:hypothetical protein [Rickettsiales bacterium]|tara:strand:- start:1560 stop:1835 length:276 start_codon:yes stop_codon:yes gene_type:complete
MTDKTHDFKGIQEGLRTIHLWRDDEIAEWVKRNRKFLQFVTRLAERVQSGEVSIDVHKAGMSVITKPYHSLQCDEVYKEMTQQLMKEVRDD